MPIFVHSYLGKLGAELGEKGKLLEKQSVSQRIFPKATHQSLFVYSFQTLIWRAAISMLWISEILSFSYISWILEVGVQQRRWS